MDCNSVYIILMSGYGMFRASTHLNNIHRKCNPYPYGLFRACMGIYAVSVNILLMSGYGLFRAWIYAFSVYIVWMSAWIWFVLSTGIFIFCVYCLDECMDVVCFEHGYGLHFIV